MNKLEARLTKRAFEKEVPPIKEKYFKISEPITGWNTV